MKKDNRQFEETGAFLDLMSKKERKRWEKEQSKLREKKTEETNNIEKINNEISEEKTQELISENNTKEETSVENTNNLEIVADSISKEELEKELEKTKQLLNLTNDIEQVQKDITNINEELNDDNDEEETKFFNPVIPLGFILIPLFATFIFLTLFTNYNNETFLVINGSILLLLTFLFGLTTLSNFKHVKFFAIFDLIIILGLIIFNGVSITNYDKMYNKINNSKDNILEENNTKDEIVDKGNKEETISTNKYLCSNEDETLNITITEQDSYIISIDRNEKFNDLKIAEKILSFYQNIEGIETKIENNVLSLKFDFNKLDIEQYKSAVEKHNDFYKLETDFSYINKNKIKYDKYVENEIKNLTCTKEDI